MAGETVILQEVLMMGIVSIVALYLLYQMIRKKAQINYGDGHYEEVVLHKGQTFIDKGPEEGVYNIKPTGFYTRFMFGIIPQSRISFLEGCPEPIAHHSGEPVLYPDDLKIPVYGTHECPKCHTVTKLVDKLLMGPTWRALLLETQTQKIGNPKKKGIDMKMIAMLGIILAVGLIVAVIASKFMGQQGAAPATPST
jgi:hypothetical protein